MLYVEKINTYNLLFVDLILNLNSKIHYKMSSERVAVVTGANKGIGYGIVQGLAQKFDGIVYLTGFV
jgi:arginase family enzyme